MHRAAIFVFLFMLYIEKVLSRYEEHSESFQLWLQVSAEINQSVMSHVLTLQAPTSLYFERMLHDIVCSVSFLKSKLFCHGNEAKVLLCHEYFCWPKSSHTPHFSRTLLISRVTPRSRLPSRLFTIGTSGAEFVADEMNDFVSSIDSSASGL